MKTLYVISLALLGCLGANLAFGAERVCPPNSSSIEEITKLGEERVAAGTSAEVITLTGNGLDAYRDAMNKGVNAGIPSTLTEIVVVVRNDKSAALFGFTNGCKDGMADLAPGIHQAAIDTRDPGI